MQNLHAIVQKFDKQGSKETLWQKGQYVGAEEEENKNEIPS